MIVENSRTERNLFTPQSPGRIHESEVQGLGEAELQREGLLNTYRRHSEPQICHLETDCILPSYRAEKACS